MNARILLAVVTTLVLSGAAPAKEARHWDPNTAVVDAQRDIEAGHIRFAYIGGIASHAPGLPDDHHTWLIVLHNYPRLEVGPQGCDQDDHFRERSEYARRYNQHMWSYVSKHR
jgi:hypothetical protein